MKIKEIPGEIGRALIFPLTGSALLPEEKLVYGAALAVFIGLSLGGIGWGISAPF